jgi:hypothetical protein
MSHLCHTRYVNFCIPTKRASYPEILSGVASVGPGVSSEIADSAISKEANTVKPEAEETDFFDPNEDGRSNGLSHQPSALTYSSKQWPFFEGDRSAFSVVGQDLQQRCP